MPSDAEITNYDPIADIFIAHAGRSDSWNNAYDRPNILARLPDLNGKRVLDLGCSTGFYTEYALEKGAEIAAVDASQKLIERLTNKIKSPKVKLHCADIGQPMPFLKSSSFDVAICSLVMDYIKDWDALLEELYRVLKKGGRVVISTGHPFSSFLYFTRHAEPVGYFDFKMIADTWARKSAQPFRTHYYVRPLVEVLRPMIQSRFRIISVDEPPAPQDDKDAPEYKQLPGFLFIVLEK